MKYLIFLSFQRTKTKFLDAFLKFADISGNSSRVLDIRLDMERKWMILSSNDQRIKVEFLKRNHLISGSDQTEASFRSNDLIE